MSEKLLELTQKYFDKNNFIIQTENINNGEKWAVIYASSHNLYKPENEEGFIKDIVKKDNYEWFKTRIPFAEKHIFIRDISKRFYRFGISNKINSLEEFAKFIKPELEGYKLITIGSSAGGTAAIELGNFLNAEYIYTFSPVLRPHGEDYPQEKIEEDLKNKKIFDITSLVKNSQIPIFYMYPSESQFDIFTANLIKDCQNIKFVPIKCPVHGIPVNKRLLKAIIKQSKEELEKIYSYKYNDSVNEFSFAKELGGWQMYFARLLDYAKKYPLFIFKKDFYNIVIKSFGQEVKK